jgi:HlyD family type I secretion membrane fusion protein
MGLWLWLGNIEESVTGTGQLVPEGKLRQVMSPINGAISKVYVRENEEVHKGQLLMELDPEPIEAERNSFTSQLVYLQNEAMVLKAATSNQNENPNSTSNRNSTDSQTAWLNASRSAYQAQVSALKMQIEKTKHLRQQALEKKNKLTQLLSVSENTLERYKKLNQEGGITIVELNEYEQKTIDTRGELAAIEEEVKAKEIELTQAQEQLKQAEGDYKKEILLRLTDHERNILSLEGEINKNQVNRKRQSIYAPMNGIINEQLFHGTGEVIASGQSLMTIVPKSSKLIAEVKVTNKDLSYINAGQRVSLMIDAFPYQKFGRLHGQVVAISPSTIAAQPQDRDPTPHYIVRIKSEKDFMQDGKTIIPLKAGMTLTADIITREKNVLSFFTEPLNFSFDRAFRDPSSRAEKL